MGILGTMKEGKILLDELVPIPDGTRVEVNVSPVSPPRKGSPEAVLGLAGTLTDEEAEHFDAIVKEMRQIEPGMWGPGPFGK